MAAYLRSIDPNRHLVTTSTGGVVARVSGLEDALFSGDTLDLAQTHVYGTAGLDTDFTTALPHLAAHDAGYGKPLLVAEAGVDFRGPDETLQRDPHLDGLHDLLWAGVFAPSIGTGMTWWWDSIVDPHDAYPEFGRVAALVKDVAFDREAFRTDAAQAGADGFHVAASALVGRTTALAWIRNADNQWWKGRDDRTVTGAVLTLAGLADGAWRARWLPTRDAPAPGAQDVAVSGGTLALPVPAFSLDLALRLEKQP
jgi:hypothetical protein